MAKTLIAWSSGKDSAWTLHVLRQRADVEVAGLFTTINESADRVATHAVRRELVIRQANAAGLPLDLIPLPSPCHNDAYEAAMGEYFENARVRGVTQAAFGDLFLDDVRRYREETMRDCGISPVFPIYGSEPGSLARSMIDAGIRARITCLDPARLPAAFAGREFDSEFLESIPPDVDPCGENGEFHTFVTEGPMFAGAVPVSVGRTVERDGFVFTDLVAATGATDRDGIH
jgi:uncharacterized protein (TIGR00290 family)